MDRLLNALVNLDVAADVVRIDVRGTLNHHSRPALIHTIGRVRRMGISTHLRVDLSQAALVQSAALAGLRSDLNAVDTSTLPGIYGAGVSLNFTPAGDAGASLPGADPLLVPIEGFAGISADAGAPGVTGGLPLGPASPLEELCGRPPEEYTDAELLTASDSLFALLDNPEAFAGSDLLGRYNDIGYEILRRQQGGHAPFTAAEDQAAS